MNFFHTLIIKVASAVAAVLLFVGVGNNDVTVVDVQDSGVTVTTATTTQEPSSASVSVSATVLPQTEQSNPVVKPTVVVVPTNQTTGQTTTTVTTTQVTPTQAVIVPVTVITQSPAGAVEPTPQPTVAASAPVINQPMPQAKIEIKNPLPGKGLGRTLKWRATPIDELNEINIGAVVTNPDGSINTTATVEITATDASQNKTLQGTGNVSTFGDPNNPKGYYPFDYYIKESGLHKITFTVVDLGISADVSINVTEEDTR